MKNFITLIAIVCVSSLIGLGLSAVDGVRQVVGRTDTVSTTVGGVKTYYATLTQTGTGAPAATVMPGNTVGAIVWGYSAPGNYTATLTGAFTTNKTWTTIQYSGPANNFAKATIQRTSADVLTVQISFDGDGLGNDLLINAPVQILVFP